MMFKNPFSFDGRIRRTEFGISMLIYIVIAVIINVIIGVGANSGPGATSFLLILYIPALWFLWAQGAKRCHDRNNSGWFQVIPFYSLWMLFADGDHGENMYGADPKGRDNSYNDSNILDTPETF
ncbi:MAG: DUF805 domain-containing protein [Saprospiraceae bacterium]